MRLFALLATTAAVALSATPASAQTAESASSAEASDAAELGDGRYAMVRSPHHFPQNVSEEFNDLLDAAIRDAELRR